MGNLIGSGQSDRGMGNLTGRTPWTRSGCRLSTDRDDHFCQARGHRVTAVQL